jgi:hypothetical protein
MPLPKDERRTLRMMESALQREGQGPVVSSNPCIAPVLPPALFFTVATR